MAALPLVPLDERLRFGVGVVGYSLAGTTLGVCVELLLGPADDDAGWKLLDAAELGG